MPKKIMSMRLLLLAIKGKKTYDPYERGAGLAVRRYLLSLCYPIIIGLSILPILGYVLLGSVSLGVNLLWVLLVLFFVLNASVYILLSVAGHIRTKVKIPFYTLSLATRFMLRMSKLHGTPKAFVYVHEDENDELTNTAAILDFGWWRVMTSKPVMQSKRFARGVLGHELGHMVLPLGYHFFFLCRLVLTPIDALATQTGRMLEGRYYRLRKDIKPHDMSGVWDDSTRFTRVLHVIHRFAWHCSSFVICHRREYACDAIGALFLRDTTPLIKAFQTWVAREGQLLAPIYLTHPSHGQRINALLDIDWDARSLLRTL